MPRINQLYIDLDNGEYLCRPCNRTFETPNGARNHCQNATVHVGEWCERCDWLFVSCAAFSDHITNSSRHHECKRCELDYHTFEELREHNVNVHHLCTDCGLELSNDNNLRQHKRSHLPSDIECFGCDREFPEFSAIMIHLESGNCESGVDRDDIDNWVFSDQTYSRWYTTDWMQYYRYQCPTCDTVFRFASGLLQHVATDSCSQSAEKTNADFKNCIYWRI